MADRIVEQVPQQLTQPIGIGRHPNRVNGRQVDGRRTPAAHHADLGPDEIVEIDIDAVDTQRLLVGPGEGFADFVIESPRDQPGMTHLIGIESPGLTAALAIGRFVADLRV